MIVPSLMSVLSNIVMGYATVLGRQMTVYFTCLSERRIEFESDRRYIDAALFPFPLPAARQPWLTGTSYCGPIYSSHDSRSCRRCHFSIPTANSLSGRVFVVRMNLSLPDRLDHSSSCPWTFFAAVAVAACSFLTAAMSTQARGARGARGDAFLSL